MKINKLGSYLLCFSQFFAELERTRSSRGGQNLVILKNQNLVIFQKVPKTAFLTIFLNKISSPPLPLLTTPMLPTPLTTYQPPFPKQRTTPRPHVPQKHYLLPKFTKNRYKLIQSFMDESS